MHFNFTIVKAIQELKVEVLDEYGKCYKAYAIVSGDKELERKVYFVNPLNYIGTEEKSDTAKYCRIRVRASDATSALKLIQAGILADYQLVWEQPYSEADHAGKVIDWIESIV